MDLAGSLITHIDKLSSPQPRCLLKGQQDANDLQDFTVFKSPRDCHGEVSSIWKQAFEAFATSYSDQMFCSRNPQLFQRKAPSIPAPHPGLDHSPSYSPSLIVFAYKSIPRAALQSCQLYSTITCILSQSIKVNCIAALSTIKLTIQHTSYLPVLILKRLQ